MAERTKSLWRAILWIDATADGRQSYAYRDYEGAPLTMVSAQKGFAPNDRAAELLAQRAAVLP
jgi:hypothetical protein